MELSKDDLPEIRKIKLYLQNLESKIDALESFKEDIKRLDSQVSDLEDDIYDLKYKTENNEDQIDGNRTDIDHIKEKHEELEVIVSEVILLKD